jgi:four helix bundle protein
MTEENKAKAVSNFRDLLIWKMGKELVVDIYHLTRTFPQEEKFGLADQMRRAAISIPCNIAEGFNRKYSNDYKRFLFIALGSCGELETQLEIAAPLQLISQEIAMKVMEKLNHESRMIRKLLEKIQIAITERKTVSKKPGAAEQVAVSPESGPSPLRY